MACAGAGVTKDVVLPIPSIPEVPTPEEHEKVREVFRAVLETRVKAEEKAIKRGRIPPIRWTGYGEKIGLERLILNNFVRQDPTLDFSHCNLTDLPTSIKEGVNFHGVNLFKHVTAANLLSNRLTKVPDEVFQMENLTSLNLGNNPIDVLPEKIGTLKNLKVLRLGCLSLRDLPASMDRLLKLEELDLFANYGLSMLPPCLAELPELKVLKIVALESLTRLPLSLCGCGAKILLEANDFLDPKHAILIPNFENIYLQWWEILKDEDKNLEKMSLSSLMSLVKAVDDKKSRTEIIELLASIINKDHEAYGISLCRDDDGIPVTRKRINFEVNNKAEKMYQKLIDPIGTYYNLRLLKTAVRTALTWQNRYIEEINDEDSAYARRHAAVAAWAALYAKH